MSTPAAARTPNCIQMARLITLSKHEITAKEQLVITQTALLDELRHAPVPDTEAIARIVANIARLEEELPGNRTDLDTQEQIFKERCR